MAEKKKAASKSTKAEKSVKIDPQANGSAQPGFAIEKLFLKDVSVEVPNSQTYLHSVKPLKLLLN